MIKEITQFVEDLVPALGPPWAIGANLFAGHVPVKTQADAEMPERYLAVLENAGGTVLENVGGVWCKNVGGSVCSSSPSETWPDYIEKAVQLLNRAKTYFIARGDAVALYNRLHNTAGWPLTLGGVGDPQYVAIVIDAYGPPAPVENPGERGLFTFSTNYVWKIEEA